MINAVTAYVPIPGHPRSEQVYRELGERLLELDLPLMVLEGDDYRRCWLYQYLMWRKRQVTVSTADNPAKNSVAYHCVQAQKSEWLVDAAFARPDADVLVWIDYGIFSIPGMTGKIIQDFLHRAENEKAIAIPGCWNKSYIYDDREPCWRFCGGLMVMPIAQAIPYDVAMKNEYIRWITATNNLSWEVNTMARVERTNPELPIWHYTADHDASMFTAYRAHQEQALVYH